MKLDIIIPAYKAKEKIIKTIFSFGELKNYIKETYNDECELTDKKLSFYYYK